jgi:formylglycine-generating enzyme required for sulfatase activity
MVWIHPGDFTMGSSLMASELPQTQVTLSSGFWMGTFEVTQQEYLDVTGENPSYFREPTRPADSVTWIHATNYCALLTTRERAAGRIPATYQYRLPTEAEWEYACRAGTTGSFSFGDDEAELAYFGWFSGNSGFESHHVGQKQPNPWGLHDMHGNVWEWCLGWYAETHPGGSVTDPTGPPNGSDRVLRGGGWFDSAGYSRSALRNYHPPDYTKVDFGFRVVLAPN